MIIDKKPAHQGQRAYVYGLGTGQEYTCDNKKSFSALQIEAFKSY